MIIEVDYGELRSASRDLNKAAKYCGKYADQLRRKVNGGLDSLTLGHSNYTSSASYFSSAKIKALETQQVELEAAAARVERFEENARETDKKVESMMKKDGLAFRKANGMHSGWKDGLEYVKARFAIGALNSTSAGRWLDAQLRDVSETLMAYYLKAKHWYACEGGKYILGTVVKVVLVVAAVLAAFSALVTLLPVLLYAISPALAAAFGVTSAGALLSSSGIYALCTAITACISLADAMVDLNYTIKAASVAKTDPAWAARYADIDSASEALRKNCYSSKTANILSGWAAFGLDVTSLLCGVATFATRLYNGYTFFTKKYRKKANWKRHFKMWDSDGNFSLEKLVKNWEKNKAGLEYAFKHDFTYTQWVGARKRNHPTFAALERMKKSKSYKIGQKIFEGYQNVIHKFEQFAY